MRTPVAVCVASLVMLAAGQIACTKSSPAEPTPTPCTYALSTASLSFGSSGGPGSVNITTAANCSWTATSDRGWLAITSGASGTGNGTVQVSLTANANTTERSGALTVAGQTVPVRQDGVAACTLDITPTSASFNKDEAAGSFSVAAPSHCQWSATSAVSWLAVTAGNTGTGNGTVNYSVARNRELVTRTGGIAVVDRTFLVTQAADTPAACAYSVSPIEFTPCMAVPFNMAATITTQAGCTWTAEPDASWITIVEGQSGNGSGVVSFRVSDNWGLPRQSVVKLRWPAVTAGQNLRIAQAGCRYSVSTDAIAFGSSGGPGRFDVIQVSDPITCGGPTQSACRWEARADVPWITISPSTPQAGDNPVTFAVSANTSGSARSGAISVADRVVRITQAF